MFKNYEIEKGLRKHVTGKVNNHDYNVLLKFFLKSYALKTCDYSIK